MALLSASILSADFLRLEQDARAAIEAGADWLHVDVMDGQFVPNISIGLPIVRALRPLCDETGTILDVHLMISAPDRYIPQFVEAGADVVTVHAEACVHLHRSLQLIRSEGARAGLALNPATPLDVAGEVLHEIDLVLVMSVNPGFAGQSYIPRSTERIRGLRQMLNADGVHAHVEVDGGIKPSNASEVVRAGADVVVAASAIFGGDIPHNVAALKRSISTPTR